MKVFLSSTIYDLIDIRAEISDLLRSLNISPILSDDKLSDFAIGFDANSIATCLINVEQSDEIIVILDRRYGPSLEKAGYENISATHLEYKHAVEHKKPIHFFVRDRTEADYAIWNKNGRREDTKLTWVTKENFALFPFLDEHRKLAKTSTRSNWVTTFSSITDLKASIRKHFEKRIRSERLIDAIYEGRFPIFQVELRTEHVIFNNVDGLKLNSDVKNIGGTAAFNFQIFWEGEENELSTIMAPGQSTTMTLIYGLHPNKLGISRNLVLKYDTPLGIAVTDRYEVHAIVHDGPQKHVRFGARLLRREFSRANSIDFEIRDN